MDQYEVESFFKKEITSKVHSLLVVNMGGITTDTTDNIALILTKNYSKGIWFSTYYPTEVLLGRVGFQKGEGESILFIDSASKEKNCSLPKNAIDFPKTTSLSEVSRIITKTLDSGKKFRFFFSESFSNILSENKSKEAAQFINYLLAKLKNHGVEMVVISLKGIVDAESIKAVQGSFDKVLTAKD